MKPIIVLSPQTMPMEAPFCGTYTYSNSFNSDALLEAGAIPEIPAVQEAAEAEELLRRADGLFLTGGCDVSPALYGEAPVEACGTADPVRDVSDRVLLEAALKLRKPILCICRGFQMTNVCLGGTLWQDLDTQYHEPLHHRANTEAEYRRAAHTVTVLPDTPLHRLFGADSLEVNSLHHQAVRTLAPDLRPMAVAPDGIVESWYLPGDQWLRGYQWHPEMMEDPAQRSAIFGEFLDACGRNR